MMEGNTGCLGHKLGGDPHLTVVKLGFPASPHTSVSTWVQLACSGQCWLNKCNKEGEASNETPAQPSPSPLPWEAISAQPPPPPHPPRLG